MQVVGKKVPETDGSLRIGIYQDDLNKSIWHFHDHYEISYITKGAGKRIVADSIMNFYPGDMVFIGRKLPHVWIADKDYSLGPDERLEMVFLQFTDEVLSPQMLGLPEFRHVKRAVGLSDRGIQITGQTLNEVSEIMLQMPYLGKFERVMNFFRLMDIIGQGSVIVPLASEEYVMKRFEPVNKRISHIHDFFLKNYHLPISLSELAREVNMAEGSFCRFFRERAGCTPFEYLNRIKTDFACKFLLDEDMSITEVAYESGFNNLSHFNKQFRKNTGMTPTGYKRQLKGRGYQ